MKDKKFKNDEVLEKKFQKGDVIIATSERSATSMCIATGMWICKYEDDIPYDKAVEIHYENMNRDFPTLNFTLDVIKKSLKPSEKYFIDNKGGVHTYYNHEKADVFDLIYFDQNNKLSLGELSLLKNQYVEEFGIEPTIYNGDEWPEYRVYEDVDKIKEWISKQLNKNNGTN